MVVRLGKTSEVEAKGPLGESRRSRSDEGLYRGELAEEMISLLVLRPPPNVVLGIIILLVIVLGVPFGLGYYFGLRSATSEKALREAYRVGWDAGLGALKKSILRKGKFNL